MGWCQLGRGSRVFSCNEITLAFPIRYSFSYSVVFKLLCKFIICGETMNIVIVT